MKQEHIYYCVKLHIPIRGSNASLGEVITDTIVRFGPMVDYRRTKQATTETWGISTATKWVENSIVVAEFAFKYKWQQLSFTMKWGGELFTINQVSDKSWGATVWTKFL